MLVPVRKVLILEHELPYPSGTATGGCARRAPAVLCPATKQSWRQAPTPCMLGRAQTCGPLADVLAAAPPLCASDRRHHDQQV